MNNKTTIESNIQRLLKELEQIEWKSYVDWGSVHVQIREGKPTMVRVESTYNLI